MKGIPDPVRLFRATRAVERCLLNIGEDNVHPLARQLHRGSETNAARSASDHRRIASEIVHVSPRFEAEVYTGHPSLADALRDYVSLIPMSMLNSPALRMSGTTRRVG